MAHRVPTPVLPNDPDQDEADEMAAEMAADGYADDEDGDDEVFDEHGDDDAFLAAAGPQADGQQQPGHAAAGPAAEPCCICMASPKDTILLPCGHACMCSTCAALLEAQGRLFVPRM
nr:E3 ubiquitin-protein ligase NEURL1B-like [Hydra vulgaris]